MIRRLIRSWGARVAVEGGSMRPTLEPGDWLLADPDAYATRPPAVGDLVLVPDPREPARVLVKRVAEVHDDGRELFVTGDARLTAVCRFRQNHRLPDGTRIELRP